MAKRRSKKRRARQFVWPAWLTIVLFIGMLSIGAWLWRAASDANQITDTIITTREPDEIDLIERAVSTHLGKSSWFGILDHASLSLFSSETLENELLELFPRFKKADVAVFDNQLIIELEQRRPAGLWCKTTKEKEECWFFDHTMTLYSRAPRFSEGVYIKYSNKENTAPSIGEQILDDELRIYSNQIIEVVEAHDLQPTRMTFGNEGVVHIFIQSLFELDLLENAHLILNKDQSIRTIDERLLLLLATPEFKEEVERAPEDFQYADLRFPGRLVYKMKDEE